MGGYNTYCEILSFDKPALIVPRVAAARGAADPRTPGCRTRPHRMLLPEQAVDPRVLPAR